MNTTDLERIAWAVDGGVATVTMNRPEKRNALDARTIAELTEAVSYADGSADVRVLMIRGAGPDFCGGADLAELERIVAGAGPIENLADASALGELFVRMRRARVPIVAAVHGNAIGGGAGLATAADLIIASEDAVLGYPEVRLGFVPALVMVLLRKAVGEKVVFDLASGGHRISAVEAHHMGLVTRVFHADRFEVESLAFARELAGRSSSAIQLIKRLLYGGEGLSLEDALARAAEVNVLARATPDCQDGVRKFLERRRS